MIDRIEFMKIVSLLNDFSKLCDDRQIKFGAYTEQELLQILKWYKLYRTGEKPPF